MSAVLDEEDEAEDQLSSDLVIKSNNQLWTCGLFHNTQRQPNNATVNHDGGDHGGVHCGTIMMRGKYGHAASNSSQTAALTSCVLRYKPLVSTQPQTPKKEDVPNEDGFINRCFSFTIRRDKWGIPSMIVGNFIQVLTGMLEVGGYCVEKQRVSKGYWCTDQKILPCSILQAP
ncbi:hypothetical protein EDD22DRAFT_847317 [Suillus occidentalis]|nr:hypothetical protein EDD22DRAFT_847317 [Suillus occidentalis]